MVEWNTLAWILSLLPVLLLASMGMMPESPTWLLSNHLEDEAMRVLQTLCGSRADVRVEWNSMRHNILPTCEPEQVELEQREHQRELRRRYQCNPLVWKPMVIASSLLVFQQFSGINVVFYNTVHSM